MYVCLQLELGGQVHITWTWSRQIRKMHNGRTNPSHEGELQNLWMQGMVISSMLATPKMKMFFTHA